ncbi:probable voltage-dependent N-type calcium channel subunit alpha-1B [Saccostrea echinata]|uniref:probable voltage-dependent N-type calcium channel subunit alpha-1B n=1 Tax=Saccostrea echinata TaxID=191078 RepID=UPI002A821FCE|nr:probable voltage-dependent N-type calcium channel subunit alpha-1B [Saccostrea echinata]
MRRQKSSSQERRTIYELVSEIQTGPQLHANTINDRSLFIFERKWFVRRIAIYVTESKFFEIFILITIIANCIVLALEEHLPNNDKTKLTIELEKSEVYFLSIFTAEAVLKIIAKGFICGKNAYLRDNWNKLDFTVVILGILEHIITFLGDDIDLNLLRLARVLRALRLISGIPNMKIVTMTIFRSVFPLLPVFFLVTMAVLIFAIIGMDYYQGAFNRACFKDNRSRIANHDRVCLSDMVEPQRPCQVDLDSDGHHCTGNTTCRRYWIGPNRGITSFNNIGLALLTVFQCLTMEGWTDLYYWTNDAKGTRCNWLYFIPLIMFCALFMMNLVLGILKGVFTREREKIQREKKNEKFQDPNEKQQMRNYFQWINRGEEIMCREQSSLPKQTHESFKEAFKREMSKIRILYVRRIVDSDVFFWGTMSCVAANTVITATEHYNQPQWLDSLQYYMEILFVVLFTIEVVLRVCAHGYRQYFYSSFNRFDVLVWVISVIGLILLIHSGNQGLRCSVFRSLRLLRVFKKTRYNDKIEKLIQVMAGSISYMLSLLFLLFLFLFVTSLIGMQLFGGRFNFEEGRPASHFDSFPKAILTVFQIITAEDWNSVMYNGVRAYGGIDGVGVSVVFFFIIAVLFGNYTLLNVFFAIAVDSLAEAKERSESEKKSSREIIDFDCRVRVFVRKVVHHDWFEKLVMVCIVLSSITLAAEDPSKGNNSVHNKVLFWIDSVFAIVFTMEMILKIIDMGFVLHEGSYLRYAWNYLDAVIVVASIVSLFIRDSNTKSLKIFRVLRILRILRTINVKTFKGLKTACEKFLKSVKSVGPLVLIYVLMHFTFAIMAVQLLKGRLCYCTDITKQKDQCRGTFIQYTGLHFQNLKVSNREWKRRDFHFDNVFAAMTTLFVITTGEGWPDILDSAISSSGIDKGPKYEVNLPVSIFFVVYIAIAPFFFLNVFIAMITVAFQSEKGDNKNENVIGLTENQEHCILYVAKTEPDRTRFVPKDASKPRRIIWELVISDHFENFIMLMVILNTICLVMDYQDQPEKYALALWYSNLTFVVLFLLEASLKILALHKNYFSDNWNKMDFVLLLGSVVDVILDFHQIQGINFRAFRAARVIKLLKKFRQLRFLLWSFYVSMKSLPYVFFLNFLSFYVFAVLGMQIFGDIKLDDKTSINKYNNFKNIGTSLLVLFRCATGENWQQIMLDCMDGRSCEGAGRSTSCGTDWAYLYFILFITLSTFLVMNLFEAVIVNNFDYLHRDPSEVGPQHLYAFTDLWHKYASFHDPATMNIKNLEDFVKSMEPPLGFGSRCPKRQVYLFLMRMNLKLTRSETDGSLYVNFSNVMFGLVRLALGLHNDQWKNENYAALRSTIKKQLKVDEDRLNLMIPDSQPEIGLREYIVIKKWKKFSQREMPLSENAPRKRLFSLNRKGSQRVRKPKARLKRTTVPQSHSMEDSFSEVSQSNSMLENYL